MILDSYYKVYLNYQIFIGPLTSINLFILQREGLYIRISSLKILY